MGTAGQLCLQLAPEHTHQQYLHASWHIAKGVAIMLLLPENPNLDGEYPLEMLAVFLRLIFVIIPYTKEKGPEVDT